MIHSQTITFISEALLEAQKNIGAASKDAVNPFFKSKYADLGSVMEACKAALNDAGISVLQPVESDEHGTYVETMLVHISGEYIGSRMRLAIKEENNPQAQGSAISYARRYSLQSLVFIPAADDDGESATPHVAKKAPVVPLASEFQRTKIKSLASTKGKELEAISAGLAKSFGTNFDTMTIEQANAIVTKLEALPDLQPELDIDDIDEKLEAQKKKDLEDKLAAEKEADEKMQSAIARAKELGEKKK